MLYSSWRLQLTMKDALSVTFNVQYINELQACDINV